MNNKTINNINPFQLLSKYRTHLMGFAIIWVILSHIAIPIIRTTFLFKIGYGGVDIFLFLSGFGLYYSSLKKESKLYFYAKRLFRIYPIYIIALLLFHFFEPNDSLFVFLMRATTLSFWLSFKSFEWFIPSLLLLYALFPFYSKLFLKSPYWVTLFMVLIGFCLSLLFAYNYGADQKLMFFTRIPIFVLGVLAGYLSLSERVNWQSIKIALYILMAIAFAVLRLSFKFLDEYLPFGLYWLPFVLIVPGLTILISSILEKLKVKNIISRFLHFVGCMCFELYLVHFTLFQFIDKFANMANIPWRWMTLIVLVASVIIAYLLSLLSNKLTAIYKRD